VEQLEAITKETVTVFLKDHWHAEPDMINFVEKFLEVEDEHLVYAAELMEIKMKDMYDA